MTIQNQILLLLREMCREMDLSVIFITHDLGVVAELCDRVVVLYGGLVMEEGGVEEIFEHPRHPYTLGLMASIPRLDQDKAQRLQPIPGSPPNLLRPPAGCPFAPRCRSCMKVCLRRMPPKTQLSDTHYSYCWLRQKEAAEGGERA